MIRVETVFDETCKVCGATHDLSHLPHWDVDDVACTACGASLSREAEISYIDNCPLCGVSFDAGQPLVFVLDSQRVNHWLCRKCENTPRGTFHFYHQQAKPVEKPAPPCVLCAGPSILLALTHDQPDGEYLCEVCAATPKGRQMIREHYEDSR